MQKEKPQLVPIDPEIRRAQQREESLVYGRNAVEAVFRARPGDIVKAYFTEETAPGFTGAMKVLAAARRVYRVVTPEEMLRIAKTQHTGGVAVVVKKRPVLSVAKYLAGARGAARDCVLALEEVGNPHNLGAIVRSAAHFGVRAIVCASSGALDSGAAARVAEGGSESLRAIETSDFELTMREFRAGGYALVTTSSHQGTDLFTTRLPARAVVVMGEEVGGVTPSLMRVADITLRIPGTGAVESLNVSVAAALVLGEWWRQIQDPEGTGL